MPTKKKILVVDDDMPLCEALDTKFGNKGYEVTIVQSGEEAKKLLDEEEFDVVLTDLHMPDVDGFAVLSHIKKSKNPRTPAFVITNLGKDEFCEKALKLGAKKCFVKSIVTLRDVVEAIDVCVGVKV